MNTEYPELRYGMLMALCCASLWSILAPVLELAVSYYSPLYIVWFRFTFSFIATLVVLQLRGKEPLKFLIKPPPLVLLGGLMLTTNYYGFMKGVELGGSITAQILIQFGNISLISIGIFYFHEKISRVQFVGMVLAFIGMVTFAYEKGHGQISSNISAIWYLLIAAILWSIYSSIQKIMSQKYPPQLLNVVVYATAVILLFPLIHPGEIINAPLAPTIALIFCGLNTFIAYAALAEALKNAPVTLTSPIITLNPLITIVLVYFLTPLNLSWLRSEHLTTLAYLAGILAVSGVTIVVSQRKK